MRFYDIITHSLSNTEPQASPPPIASIKIKSPFLNFFSKLATDKARGIDAAEVFP